jgi:hypothetical protein
MFKIKNCKNLAALAIIVLLPVSLFGCSSHPTTLIMRPQQPSDRCATVVVATSTSTALEKAGADYDLTGANDQVILNTAMAAAQNGTLQLMSGKVNLTSWNISGCLVRGQGSGITTIDTTGGVTVSSGKLQGCTIHAPTNFSGTALTVGGSKSIFSQISKILDDIFISCPSYTGTGLQLVATYSGGVSQSYIALCSFGDISVRGFAAPVVFATSTTTPEFAYINGNTFSSMIVFGGTTNQIYLNAGPSADIVGNTFNAIQLEPISSTTVNGLVFNGQSAYSNMVNSFMPWDWKDASGKAILSTNAGKKKNLVRGYSPTANAMADAGLN